jgi:outer membrane protein TolC
LVFVHAQLNIRGITQNKLKTIISQQEDRIRIEMDNVNLRLGEARRRIAAAEKNVNSAERAFEIAEIRVQNGLATQLELKDSRVFLDRARLNYYRAIYDYLSAYFDWEITTGIASKS